VRSFHSADVECSRGAGFSKSTAFIRLFQASIQPGREMKMKSAGR